MIFPITNLPYVLFNIMRQNALKHYLRLNKNKIVSNNKWNLDSMLVINNYLAVFITKDESNFYITDHKDRSVRITENELINQINNIMIA